MKRLISFALALIFSISLSITASATSNGNLSNFNVKNPYYPNQFSDVPSSLWCAENVAQVYELGLMLGNSETTFNPNGAITEAQALTIAARIHKIYTTGNDDFSDIKQEMENLKPQILEWVDGDTNSPAYMEFYDSWYSPYAYYLCYHTGDDYAYPIYPFLGADPDQAPFIDSVHPLSRERFAYYMAYALPDSEFQEINTIFDDVIPDVSSVESPEVYRLYRAGVIIGSDKIGTFNPTSNISRGAVAAIITRIVNPNLRQHITLVPNSSSENIVTPVEQSSQTNNVSEEEYYKLASDACKYIKLKLTYPHSLDLISANAGILDGDPAVEFSYFALNENGQQEWYVHYYTYTPSGRIASWTPWLTDAEFVKVSTLNVSMIVS